MTNEVYETIPGELKDALVSIVKEYPNCLSSLDRCDSSRRQLVDQSLGLVWVTSSFVAEQCVRNPAVLDSLIKDDSLFSKTSYLTYRNTLKALLKDAISDDDLMGALRCFRNREMVRIAWRDIAGWARLEDTLLELSLLAQACVEETLEQLFLRTCQKKGTPTNQAGEPQRLVVLGMGKLGAWELNFSSDIDLIFCYEDEGILPDKKGTSFGEFYTRLAQSLIKALDAATPDGFVFRVDTRLRPFGDSGPLVMNFDGMEMYYQGQAREWERYAMVKARVVAGDPKAAQRLQEILIPFVYRRYLDFRAFGELRELKAKITVELSRKDRMDNVKLGPGGIREIEFIGQAFQLIRGGQEKSLRERSILKVLDRIGELGYLPFELVGQLKDSYRFLRLVENRIQQYADKQTHDLPKDHRQRLSLAFSMGFSDWDGFKSRLDEVRTAVHEIFDQVVESPQTAIEAGQALNWVEAERAAMEPLLTRMGYRDVNLVLKLMDDFQKSHPIRNTTSKGIAELNRIMPLLLSAISKQDNAIDTLSRILKLLEAIAGRNVYFTLLAEYPQALSHLVRLASASSWIVNYISRFPLLLDELLDPQSLYSPLSREQLDGELSHALAAIDVDDMEQLLNALRQFKQANVLRIAAADIMGVIPIMVVSDYLSWLAEVILGRVLQQAWRLTAQRHGVPPGASVDEVKGFGVIAYGKLGGLELSYSSDLDLVFLFGRVEETSLTSGESPITAAQFYARIGKRIINILTTHILSGTLYEIDLRLRPSGNSGLLVSSLDAYEAYQMDSAWTWEQQALVRARFVAGDPKIAGHFLSIRRKSLVRSRAEASLRAEVRQMREKMREKLEDRTPGVFDLKQARGGIADIEFIVQFGVLLCAHEHESLFQWTDVVRLLKSLREAGFLDRGRAELLREAYCLYRERSHRAALLEHPAIVPEGEFALLRSRVQTVWREIMEC